MYLFKSSYLKARNKNYENVDITRMKMSEVINNFIDGYIELNHRVLKGTFYLTIEALRNARVPMDLTLSFNDWLALNHKLELPTQKEKPEYKEGVVKYSDAIYAGFKVNLIGRYKSVKDNIPTSELVDIYLEKTLPTKRPLYRNMLTLVNGFLHRHIPHENGVAILNGGETFLNSGVNTVGILSFYSAPEVQQVPITEDMIKHKGQIFPIRESVIIKLPEAITSKRVMMSLGGYLIYDERVIKVLSYEEGLIQLTLKQLDIIKMMYNSVGHVNLEPLGIFPEDGKSNLRKLRVAEVLSDIILRKYLTLSQSFFILVEADDLEITKLALNDTGVPSYYETTHEPIYPLVNSFGIMPEYWKRKVEDYWCINITDDVSKRRLYEWNVNYELVGVNAISGTHDWYHDKPEFLIIKTITKVIKDKTP